MSSRVKLDEGDRDAEGEVQRKRRRITRACDGCHNRSIRCVQFDDGQCKSCKAYEITCTYDRPKLSRGPAPKHAIARSPADSAAPSTSTPSPTAVQASASAASNSASVPSAQASASTSESKLTPASAGNSLHPVPTGTQLLKREPWRPPAIAHSPSIPVLCEYYYQTIYPCTPLFHWPTFMPRIRAREYLTSRPFCATILSLCAIASARWRECGPSLIFVPPPELSHLPRPPPDVPEEFLEAARETTRVGPSPGPHDFDDIRAAGLLTIAAVQFGLFDELAYWMGVYVAMVGKNSLHAEHLWPADLSVVERDERRHLVWLIYQHDVYTSVVVGGTILHREIQIEVAYPTEMPDTPSPFWIEGWNKTTDIYRILEHACNAYRNIQHASTLTRPLLVGTTHEQSSALLTDAINALRESLPPWCTVFRPVPDGQEIELHRLNFTALNLLLTFQNASIISLCARNGFTTEEGVAVASELVRSLDQVPPEYLQAMNMPLFYQLIGVGIVLQSGAAPAVTSQSTLVSVQSVLRDMSRIIKLLANGSQSELIMNAALVLDKHVEDLGLLIRPSDVSADASALLGLPADLFEWPADMPQFESLFPDLTMVPPLAL